MIYWTKCYAYNDELKRIINDNEAYKTAINNLKEGRYTSLNLEKLRNDNDIYSIRVKSLNSSDRILLKMDGDTIIILDIAINHKYDKAIKRLNTSPVLNDILNNNTNNNLPELFSLNYSEDNDELTSKVNFELSECTVHNGKIISLSKAQKSVLNDEKLPLIIRGVAGSGKTLIAQQLIYDYIKPNSINGKAIYFVPTSNLKEEMTKLIEELLDDGANLNQDKVTITTANEYISKITGKEIHGFEEFVNYYNDISNSKDKVVLDLPLRTLYNGLCIASSCKDKNEYINLGTKQSLPVAENIKDNIWLIYENYKIFLLENTSVLDPNIQNIDIENKEDYEFLIVDEMQSYHHNVIKLMVSINSSSKALFLGDINQSMLGGTVSTIPYMKKIYFQNNINIKEDVWHVSETLRK